MLTLSSLEPFTLSNLLIATVLGKLGKLGRILNTGLGLVTYIKYRPGFGDVY